MSQTVVFVDDGLADAPSLLAAFAADARVFRLDPAQDGVLQITRALAGLAGVGSVHILSHGAPGALALGATVLNGANIEAHAAALGQWGASLEAGADILLYGCSVAGDAIGQAFVDAFARLTGADVAASTNATGALSAGGDWLLESSSGAIGSVVLTAAGYGHALAMVEGSPGNDSLAGTAGNDTLTGGAGTDTLLGSGGTDVAVFAGNSGDYRLGRSAEGYLTVQDVNGADGNDGQDFLHNVEILRFADRDVLFAPGGEFRVNTTTSDYQSSPAIAELSGGGFVVAWMSNAQDGSGFGVYAQRYDASGLALGSEFRASTASADFQGTPAVAALAGGGFVVAWQSVGQDGSLSGVYAQRYAADGAAAGSEFLVNYTVEGSQSNAVVAGLSGGGFVIGWQSVGQDGDGTSIHAQRYGADGVAEGTEFRINNSVVADQELPAIAALAGGGFVVTWVSDGQDGSGAGVFGRRFGANGSEQGSEFRVNTTTYDAQQAPAVTALAGGGFVIAWESADQDGSGSGVYAQRFNANGVALGGEFRVATLTAGDQRAPALSALDDGGFVISWSSRQNLGEGNLHDVYGQRYDAVGIASGGEFRISSNNTGYADAETSVAGLSGGGFVAAWQALLDGSGTGIFAQRLDAGGAAVSGTLRGTAGNDRIDIGGAGDLRAAGGAGDDTYVVNSSGDQVLEGAGAGTDLVESSVSLALGNNLENLTLSSAAGAIDGSGNELANVITGNSYDNVLDGRSGDDLLNGGAGSDTAAYAGADAALHIDLSLVTAQDTGGAGSDTLVSIENLRGGAYADLFRGNASANALGGGGGDDTLSGAAGNDTLDGGAGADLAEFTGDSADYRFGWTSSGYLTVTDLNPVDGSDGTDHVRNVETLRFADRDIVAFAGGEIRVNATTPDSQSRPAIATLVTGGYVVTWQSVGQDGQYSGIYAQRHSANGVALGEEFLVSTSTVDDQDEPAIAALADGGFVISWRSDAQDGSAGGVYAQRYGATGARQGGEFRVNTATDDAQGDPAIAALADGGFVVSWNSFGQDGSGNGIYAQRFDAAGAAQGSELLVNSYIDSDQQDPAIAVLAGGGFVIVWESGRFDAPGVYGQRFGADGGRAGAEFRISATAGAEPQDAAVASLAGGGFVVVWTSDSAGSGHDIRAQRFDANGARVGDEFRVNTTLSDQQESPAVTGLAGGGFVVSWLSEQGSIDMIARLYDAGGVAVGGEFRVTVSGAAYANDAPALAATPDGGFVVSWESYGQDGGAYGVFAQRFDANGVSDAAEIRGTAGDDRIDIGGSGALQAAGGAGDDTYVVGNAGDRLVEVAGAGTDTVEALLGWTLGNHFENLALLDAGGAIDGTGNDGANRVTGNGSANWLDGRGGDDTLDGGAGSDGASYAQAGAGVTLSLDFTGPQDAGTAGNDTLLNIENLRGSAFADRLSGNASANSLAGGAAADTLTGGAGADTLEGGSGADVAVYSGASADYRFGWSDNGYLVVTDLNPVDGDDGTDLLRNVETLRFADRDIRSLAGGEIRVNTTTLDQQRAPAIAPLADGGHVVVWQSLGQDGSGYGIFLQRYSAAGVALGEELQVNSTVSDAQQLPAVAALAGGGFVVAWQSEGQDGQYTGVFAQRFDASGVADGAEFQVNTTIVGPQESAVVTGLSGGGFVISWHSYAQNGNGWDVYAQRYSAGGVAQGTEFLVNTTTPGSQDSPAAAALNNGGFVLSWQSFGQDGSGSGIYAQRFDANGAALGAEFRVNTTTASEQAAPQVTVLAGGAFVITWQSYSQDGTAFDIHAQRFTANGVAAGAEFRVNTRTADYQDTPSVTALAGGGFVVSWQSYGQDGSGYGVYAQRFDAAGAPLGDELRVNTVSAYDQASVAVGALADGGFVVTWSSAFQDGSGYGIHAQRFGADGVAERLQISGTAGDDRIDLGGNGDLQAAGGLGDDVYSVDSTGDRVLENAGQGSDTVQSSIDWSLGDNFEHLLLTGVAAVDGLGNALDNTLTGNDAANVLDGSGGANILDGGAGSDTASYAGVAVAVVVDLAVATGQSVGDGRVDTLLNIENLEGSGFADRLSGDALANALAGGDGNDTLAGAAGNDALGGGAGADSLTGGAGSDVLDGGQGADVAVFAGAVADYRFGWQSNGYLTVTDVNPENGDEGSDTLIRVETLRFADRDVAPAPGGEFLVNTVVAGSQQNSVLVALAGGGFVASWEGQDGSGQGVYAQRYSATGVALGDEFRVNTETYSDQHAPSLAALAGGGFVITWSSWSQDGSGYGVYAQRYNANGAPLGGEFRVNTFTSSYQQASSVTALGSGDFVVSWESGGQDGSGYGIHAQRYNANGVVQGAEFLVNTVTDSNQQSVSLGSLAAGGFVATWASYAQDGSGWGVYAQRFGADGVAAGSEFRVNTATADSQQDAQVAGLAGGGFVVSWSSNAQDGSGWGVYAQRYNANGVAQGAELRVNTTTLSTQIAPAVTALSGGGFVISWQGITDGSGYGSYAQRYDASGVAAGAEFLLNTVTIHDQQAVAIGALPDGGFIASWDSWFQDGSGAGVYAQRFDADGVAVRLGVNGTAGNDRIDLGGPGDLQAAGGAGDDTYVVNGPGDRIIEAAGAGTDTVESSVSWTLTDVLENLTLTGTAAVNATGNAGANVISGNDGANLLSGAAGDDLLYGRAGTDVAAFAGNALDYLVQQNPGFLVVTDANLADGDDGTDLLVGIETLRFADGDVAVVGEFAVNATTIGAQTAAAASGLAGGAFVVVWQSPDTAGAGIFAQRYDATGGRSGEEFRVNSVTADEQASAAVATLDSGGFVVVWESGLQDGSGTGIYARRYDAAGVAAGVEFRVNTATADAQRAASVTALSGGGFVICWESNTQDGSSYGIYGQRYDASGVAAGAEFKVNTSTPNAQMAASVSALAGGGFVVGWESAGGQDGAGYGVFAQRFDANGVAAGAEFQLNTSTAGDQRTPVIETLGSGNFVAVWQSGGQDGDGTGIYAQRFSASGVAVGAEWRVNTATALDQSAPQVAALSGGGFVVSWNSSGQDGSGTSLHAQRFDASGNAVGAEFRVNTTTVGNQSASTVTALANGGFLLGWQSSGQDGSGNGIYAKRYDGNGVALPAPIIGTDGDDVLDLTIGDVAGYGLRGHDLYLVDSSGDATIENVDEGMDTVQASLSWTLGNNVENLVLAGGGAISGTGNALDNSLLGNAAGNGLAGGEGDDTLDGSAGADSMSGGDGDDVYYVDDAADAVVEAAPPQPGPALLEAFAIDAVGGLIRGVSPAADGGTNIDTVISQIDYTLGANLENLNLAASGGNLSGVGNELDNLIAGNEAANSLAGLAGNDTIDGGEGNDTLEGGSGADLMRGGLDDDVYVVAGADQVVELAGEGTDTVHAANGGTLAANIERLVLTDAGNVNATGNAEHNVLTGNAGANSLSGGAGNDTLEGGAGADTLIGGGGDDSFVVDAGDSVLEGAGNGTDTVETALSWALGGNLENLRLTGTAAIAGTGNTLANRLSGNAAGNQLDGGAGADTLAGGAGDDIYLVDAGDAIEENAAEGSDTVRSANGWTLGANLEQLELGGAAAVDGRGNELANRLAGNAAANQLDGAAGADTLEGGAGDDTYLVDDVLDSVVEDADAGRDTVQSSVGWTLAANLEVLTLSGTAAVAGVGNALANRLNGNAADNALDGLAGNDNINGAAGNDTLDGGTGADRLAGGAGDDSYRVDADDSLVENAGEGNDTVLSQTSRTLADNIENLALLGALDIGGSGNALANAITGNEGNNALSGAGGDDTLGGGAGNDTLTGGAGADQLAGGTGDDSYVVATGDATSEDAGAGTDTVESAITWTLSANVERLTLTGAAAIGGSGNDGANALTGNAAANALDGGAGNDTLAGGDGDDTLDGGAGADALAGGLGDDTYRAGAGDTVSEVTGEGVDTVVSAESLTLAAEVENLVLDGSANAAGTGNAGANAIAGNAGHNTLDGRDGTDTLAGGLGDDVYVAGLGDVLLEQAGEGADTVQSAITWTLADHLENLALTAAEHIDATGNAAANLLSGNAGNNLLRGSGGADTLVGGAGNDTLEGGFGADQLRGGSGADVYTAGSGDVVSESAGEGEDTVRTELGWTLGANLEGLLLTGTAAVNGTGNALDNTLGGNAANNRLSGGGGADVLDGAGGNDTLDGGLGADTLRGGIGFDVYEVNQGDVIVENVSAGQDTVVSAVAWTLGDNLETLALTGTANVAGTGNALANALTGNSGDNALAGGDGADTLAGAGGADTLNGGLGADALAGGLGADTYTVTAGDTVAENADAGIDTVQSAGSWTLGANLEKLTLTGGASVAATGNSLANALTGNSGANTLTGYAGADTLSGYGGSDALRGGAGSDRLIGGLGADVFVFETALSGADNLDLVTDFSSGSDRLRLDDDVFTQFGAGVAIGAAQFVKGAGIDAAQDADQRLAYDTSTGMLYYDADGAGGAAAVAFARLGATAHPDLVAADFDVTG